MTKRTTPPPLPPLPDAARLPIKTPRTTSTIGREVTTGAAEAEGDLRRQFIPPAAVRRGRGTPSGCRTGSGRFVSRPTWTRKRVNSFVVRSVYIWTKYSHNWHNNMRGTVVHLLACPTQILCSNPGYQTKGYPVSLGWCGRQGSGPALGDVPMACFGLFFLWLWLV